MNIKFKKIVSILALCVMAFCIPVLSVNAEGGPTRTTHNTLFIETEGFVEECYLRDAKLKISNVEVHDIYTKDLIRTIPINRELTYSDGTLSDDSNYVVKDTSDQLNWSAKLSNATSQEYYISLLLNPEELEENIIDDVYVNGLHMDMQECKPYDAPGGYYFINFEVPAINCMLYDDAGNGSKVNFFGEGLYKTETNGQNTFIGWGSIKDDVDSIYEELPKESMFNAYPLWNSFELLEEPCKENNYTIKTNVYKFWSQASEQIYNWFVYKDCDITVLASSPQPDDIVQGYIFHSGNEYDLKYTSGNITAGASEDPDPEVQGIVTVGGDFSGKLYIEDRIKGRLVGKTIGIKTSSAPVFLQNTTGTQTNFTYNASRGMHEFVISDENISSDCFRFEFQFSEETDMVAFVIDDNPGFFQLTDESEKSLLTREPGRYKASVKFWDDTENCSEFVIEAPVSQSSGSRLYKTSNVNKTAEKISGSAKKGSTRTITTFLERAVSEVIVTDKKGNTIETTKVADGIYSFVQPASDVNIEVIYRNREITLNIGSTEASVDGETSNLDVCPVIRNDRTMLPIRFVAENLGAKVDWDEKNPDYVLITKGDIKIEITLGSDVMKVNGKDVKLDSVAFAENDRTYLPVRAVSENLNAIVEWNEAKPMEVKIYER